MLGLIKKDLLMIKSNIKVLIILLFVYGFMAFQGEMDLSFLLPFMSVMIMISTFSYDTYNKWDAYALTLPNGRKNSVKAKYLATILLVAISVIIITLLSIIIAYIRNGIIDYENIISTMVGGVFATTLLQSFMYPPIYKFGVEKARIGIFVVVFGIAIIGGIMAEYIDFPTITKALSFMNNYWMVIIPIAMCIMLYVSYKISEQIYVKKEF